MKAACALHLSVPGVPQGLVDDTEDVSLDFGNEEELAFRKAKIRYVDLLVPSCKFIHSPTHLFEIHGTTTVCMSYTDPALLEPRVWGQGS